MSVKNNTGIVLPDNWKELSVEQKKQWRLNNYLNPPGVEFISSEARQSYQKRAKRIVDVYSIQEPDKVPINLPVGYLPYILYGINMRTALYDYSQSLEACRQFNEKYSAELEYFASPTAMSGKVMDILDYKMYAWPGRSLPLGAPDIQFLESEYMKADEYDDLIRDPSDFWFRTYLPRVFGTLEPFGVFQNVTSMTEILALSQFTPLANPEMQEMLLKLLEVGREYQKMIQILGPYSGMGPASGFPLTIGQFAKAPFDTLGDTLRGTAAIMKDLYRRPDKVLEACDKIADFTISSIIKSPQTAGMHLVTYPLHKGADGWMSQKQFETFYWPSLKKVINAFINEGFLQNFFAEGSFNTRLEYFNEFPKGSIGIWFDQTDMARAKKLIGGKVCIQGNVPSSLIVTGSPQDVKEYCRKLIENCGQGGGYMLAAGCVAENPKLDNLRAMVSAVNEYGVYRD